MVHLCKEKVVVFQVDVQNLLGIVNRESSRLKLNALARKLFLFGLEHGISLTDEIALADKLSKLFIPDDCMLGRPFSVGWRSDGVNIRWTCLPRTQTTNVGDFTNRYTGVEVRRASTRSPTIGVGAPPGYTALTCCWGGFGGSCRTMGPVTLLSDIYGTYALRIKHCSVPYRTVFNILTCVYRTVLYRTVRFDLTIWDLDKAQLYGSVF